MKTILISFFAFLTCYHVSSQEAIVYPYNPDADNDELIGVTDLLPVLSIFGESFQPGEIVVDGVALAEVLLTMQQTIEALQLQVETLEASTVLGLNGYMSVDDETQTVLLSGANLQVVNGSGELLEGNALGNIIVGYNTVDSAQQLIDRQGSHNLVLGAGNTYNGSGNIIGGSSNKSHGDFGIVSGLQNEYSGSRGGMIGGRYNISSLSTGVTIGGRNNILDSDDGAIVGGIGNENWQELGVLVGGSGNLIQTNVGSQTWANVICGGQGNTINDGNYSAIFAGYDNTVSGQLAAVVGGRDSQVHGSESVMVGSTGSTIEGNQAVVVGGENHHLGSDSTDTRFSVILGGRYANLNSGYCGVISGGYGNTLTTDSLWQGSQARSVFGGFNNNNRGGNGATIAGGHGNTLLQRPGGSADLSIGTNSFIGSIQTDNTQNIRVTGEPEEE